VKSFPHTPFSLQHAHVLCKIPHDPLDSLVDVGFLLRPSDREYPDQGKRAGAREVGHDLRMFAFVPGPVPILLKKVHLAGPLVLLCVASEKSYGRCMSTFDDMASAEVFTAEGRSGLRYWRFAQAAEAIGYAIEKLPAKVLAGSSLTVKDERYNAAQIRAFYECERYPLSRKRA
jgi:hypothetical protein